MKLYNTLTRKIDNVRPINPSELGFYACGLTVYDYAHIGNLRKYTMDDILIRTLRHAGYNVKFVQNVTDVGHLTSDGDTGEDKLEKGARKYGKSAWDIAREFEEYFWRSMDLMGNVRPDVSCRATEHIKEQIELVQTLEKKGFAYVIKGDGVYFDTSKDTDYGKLALVDLEQLKEGARVEKIAGKRNPTDFALWKFERPGENRVMSWPSPWSERSFPGWHIECSAMSMKYLGEQFDIHTGGIDHINIHHTNEIAQSESATGKVPFVKYWVHHNFLRVNDEKMSKSLGNVFTIDDILKRGFNPRAVRLLFLTAHYRSEMNFTWENLEGTQKSYDNLISQIIELKNKKSKEKSTVKDTAQMKKFRSQFFTALEDDLKTSEAVATLWETIKSDLHPAKKYQLMLEFNEVLQLGFDQPEEFISAAKKLLTTKDIPVEVQQLLEERRVARASGNWAKSDELREKLKKFGFTVKDAADAQELTLDS